MRARFAQRRGFLGFFMGILTGIILVVAAVGITFWWFWENFTLKTLEGWTGTEIVKNDEVNAMPLKELIPFVTNFVSDTDSLTINKVKDTFGFDIPGDINGIDISMLFDYPITQVPDHVSEVFDTLTLDGASKAIGFTVPNIPLLQKEEVMNAPISEAFVTIENAVNPETATIESLVTNFGVTPPTSPIYGQIKTLTLNQMDQMQDKVMELKVSEVFTDSTDPIIVALADCQLKNIGTEVTKLTVKDVMPDSTDKIIQALWPYQLDNISEGVQNMALQDVITIDANSSSILKALQFTEAADGTKHPTKISELSERMKQVTVADVFGETTDEANIFYYLQGSTIESLDTDVQTLIQETLTIGQLGKIAGHEFTNLSPDQMNMTIPQFFAYVDRIINMVPNAA